MGNGKQRRTDIRAKISGPVSGQVAIGTHIAQKQTISSGPVTAEDLQALRTLFEELRAHVAIAAPAETNAAALERVGELEQAVTAPEPDLSTMEYVTRWFAKHLPAVAGSVAAVVVNPIVGRLVAAAGDVVAAEFQRRFSGGQP